MIWYIITLVLFCCGIISKITSLPYDLCLTFFVTSAIFFIVSVITTLSCITLQKSDRISLDHKQKAINLLYENLKILEKEYANREGKFLKHEISIIECLSRSLKKEIDTSGDSVLSNNLLAQIPELNAINNINRLYNDIKGARGDIINQIKIYNDDVALIKKRQENLLIYSPFIPRYDVSYYKDVTFSET